MDKQADYMISGAEVDKMFGVARTTRYRHIEHGLIPKPIKLAATTARWSFQECVVALERIKARDRTPEQLEKRVVELHEQGLGDHQIVAATSLAVGHVRQLIAKARAAQ